MSDLRTGLVEAIARGVAEHVHGLDDDEPCDYCERIAPHVLDRLLGFLTDNADEWTEAAIETPRDTEGGNGALARYFIAALSDSRDTGEKP